MPTDDRERSPLAPAFPSVGGVDLCHDEVTAYARRLEDSGVPVGLYVIPGAHHGVELLSPTHPGTRAVQATRLRGMRRALDAG